MNPQKVSTIIDKKQDEIIRRWYINLDRSIVINL